MGTGAGSTLSLHTALLLVLLFSHEALSHVVCSCSGTPSNGNGYNTPWTAGGFRGDLRSPAWPWLQSGYPGWSAAYDPRQVAVAGGSRGVVPIGGYDPRILSSPVFTPSLNVPVAASAPAATLINSGPIRGGPGVIGSTTSTTLAGTTSSQTRVWDQNSRNSAAGLNGDPAVINSGWPTGNNPLLSGGFVNGIPSAFNGGLSIGSPAAFNGGLLNGNSAALNAGILNGRLLNGGSSVLNQGFATGYPAVANGGLLNGNDPALQNVNSALLNAGQPSGRLNLQGRTVSDESNTFNFASRNEQTRYGQLSSNGLNPYVYPAGLGYGGYGSPFAYDPRGAYTNVQPAAASWNPYVASPYGPSWRPFSPSWIPRYGPNRPTPESYSPPWTLDNRIARPIGTIIFPDKTTLSIRKVQLIVTHFVQKKWTNIILSDGTHIQAESFEEFESVVKKTSSVEATIELSPYERVPVSQYCYVIRSLRDPSTLFRTNEGSEYLLSDLRQRADLLQYRNLIFPEGYDWDTLLPLPLQQAAAAASLQADVSRESSSKEVGVEKKKECVCKEDEKVEEVNRAAAASGPAAPGPVVLPAYGPVLYGPAFQGAVGL